MAINVSEPKPLSSTLGIVAISYNENEDLPGFLEHLLPWVDEIVIVDDGSTDNTSEIALSGGEKVKFIVSPRKDEEYFSHQRNKGIKAAESDWLLHMDIDERVTPALAEEIREAINHTDYDAYRFRRLNYFLHRPMSGGGWADWNLVHLARREVFHFGGMFHESCITNTSDERIGQLDEQIHHFNEVNFQKRLRKSDTYIIELINSINAKKKRITWFQMLVRISAEFFKKYIYKRGFLDGTPGLISALHAMATMFRAHALIWDEQNKISRSELEKKFQTLWK